MPALADQFSSPARKCDVVMKGGITSGIVYPSAICALAQTYRFMNIGGTSAGAIAAAAAAAAEYRRANGSTEGFALLSGLPDILKTTPPGSKHTNLYWLFQPDDGARMLFDAAVSFTRHGASRYFSLLRALLVGAPLVWIVVVLLGVLFFLLPVFSIFQDSVFGILSGLLWLGLIATIGLAIVIGGSLSRLPGRGFGLCSGLSTLKDGPPALTPWFHTFLSDVSGKPLNEPLTFGDLRDRDIQLRMISTCLTHGRAYGLPIDTKDFYFKEDEFRQYFPDDVVNWMVAHPGPPPSREEKSVDVSGFCRLPGPSDLPVVVAARMSLSFPFLFRAVPLYAVDFTLRQVKKGEPAVKPEPGGALNVGQLRRPERCWFLDGGICSNFPVYMFDAPLPRWPTFGIDLQEARPDRPDNKVWMPERNEEGLGELWNRIPDTPAFGALGKYIFGMIDTARNWTENRQMTVPGYRDRIVHIRLDDENEGGLSLDMPPGIVDSVSKRGFLAGELLLSHFAYPKPGVTLTWDNHRWIRFRSSAGRFEEWMMEFQEGFSHSESGEQCYEDLLQRPRSAPPDSYRLNSRQRKHLADWVALLLDAAKQAEAAPSDQRASQGEPKPTPVLRLLPRTVSKPDADLGGAPLIDPQNEGTRAVMENGPEP
ncbi:MAG: patatin-like phospholipase family protein [Bryobacterales bacterium]|nr:patatin-like phospholipase family protein [Bryobacterales bacterium]